nr:N-acetylmuramoyl-L-alanine amidase-like domain-containing protein [Acanthopleuribacter pedis]
MFLGVPYEPNTLEVNDEEQLVVRFDGFDCFTFAESVLALAHAPESYENYRALLQRLRYRDGRIEGYASRLHYTTDWARENAEQGMVEDVTAALGGEPYDKTIDFMSKHRKSYQALKTDDQALSQIEAVETELNRHKRTYLPKARLDAAASGIVEGDILAITTSIAGLDVVHVGLAVFVEGRLHMLHASSKNKKVEITKEPLSAYLAGHRTQTGVMVFRPK